MNDEWETPLDLFDKLDQEFHFEVDLCANVSNHRCELYANDIKKLVEGSPVYYTSFWMNPPYSRRNIDLCMEQAVKIHRRDKTVVCLVRFDPSTKWFQKYVDGVAKEVRMLDRRVKFQGASSAYNFPCCVVVYKHTNNCIPTEYIKWGW